MMFEYLFRTIVSHSASPQNLHSNSLQANYLGSSELEEKLRFEFLLSGMSGGWREPHMPVVPSLSAPSSFL